MERRRLGRTEHRSSVAILGGAAFWDSDPEVTAMAVDRAIEAGVNHIDVAPQYGAAEERLGPHIAAHRTSLFVACKTLRHNGDGVRAQLETSLSRLQCDAVDLYQLHAVVDLEELDRRSAAIEAMFRAREEGLCRFVGITGHELTTAAAQREALRRYDLDTVMLPINPRVFGDPRYRSEVEGLLEEASRRDVGVMAIKAAAARPWGSRPRTSSTWYEPYRARDELRRGIAFALSTPGVTGFCTPGDIETLMTCLDVASESPTLSPAERADAIAEVEGEDLIFPMPR
jgi:aryl-alcohol dehydrogenase-like predicted oxidoreductase